MSYPARVVAPVVEETPQELSELAAAIAALPSEHAQHIRPLFTQVVESTKRRRRILSLVQDALGQLRLDMKYLVFDLEATRRERDAFKRQLDGSGDSGDAT
jgi:hypothetical protein